MSVAPGASYGLLAGVIADGASFKNVTVSGKILIGDSCEGLAGSSDYTIGKLTASGDTTGITYDITVEKKNPGNDSFNVEVDGNNISIVKASK